ncbi:MAG: DUF1735 domain-containing protein [Bacteroidales bacterium]|nr:DUF1735 domain-containing protein [Bacteroidales bacterium]
MRNNNMAPDSLGITSLENVVDASVHPGRYVIGIAKSGKGQTAATVLVSQDAQQGKALVEQYNAEHNTSFRTVPQSLYSMDATSFCFSEKDASKELTLNWDPTLMVSLMGDSEDYVIPVIISSGSDQVKMQQKRSFLLVRLYRSSLAVNQKTITRVIQKKTVEPDKYGNQPPLKKSIKLDLVVSKPIKGMKISWPVIADNSLIEEYNREHETSYTAAPQGLLTIDTPTVTLENNAQSCTVGLTLDMSVLLSGGELPQFPSYLVPVRLNTAEATAMINSKESKPQGLTYGNMVTYVSIEWKETKLGFDVERVWGLYSTAASAWSSNITGFTAAAERNVTLDGENIYIAEANTSKNLWAISLEDPGTYRKLPVGTVQTQGIFYLSCPRVVPNTNSEINNGKPVLVVSSMDEGDPTLYVYDKGTESDPKAITLTTWAGRRLGDTFTWWGSLQNGVLYFKDFNTTQGTVTFWLRDKLGEQFYLVGRVKAPELTGAGAFFPYPENASEGLATVRGGEDPKAWYVKSSKDLNKDSGGDDAPTVTELDSKYTDCAFRYFTLKGKRYIAYAKQEGSSAGRLVVLEGETSESWKQLLDNPRIVYQAAIQNDTEQEELSAAPSPRKSENSGMDLDIWQSGNDVYIAVVKQNVGLSLFHASNDQ